MATFNRADTINSLALAMGVNAPKGYDSNKYDTKTGTIYCKDRPVSNDSLKKAIHYFETMRSRCINSDSAEIRTVGNYYDIAISAMQACQDQSMIQQGSKLAI